MTTEAEIKEAVRRAESAGSYPEAVSALLSAGVRVYHTDVKSHAVVYSSDYDCFFDQGEPAVPESAEPARLFDIAAIRGALRTSRQDSPGFLRTLWLAGVVGYDVSLMGGRIVFSGAHGESHVERLPEAASCRE